MARIVAAVVFIFAVCASGSAQADIVINGGFETGDFTGWALSGDTTFCGVSRVTPELAHDTTVQSGQYGAYFGTAHSLTYLSQTLSTTPGQAYNLSFWLADYDGTPNEFTASWNGAVLIDQKDALFSSTFTQFDYHVIAATAGTILQFGFRQDSNYMVFDTVSVTATSVPIPGALLLLGPGFGGLAALRRRSTRRR